VANHDHLDLLAKLDASDNRQSTLDEISALSQRLLADTGRGLQLTEANLAGLDLSGADLTGAVLNRATLHSTSLRGANLDRVTMICPGMERTDLRAASMRDAYVHALSAQTCKFDGADLTNMRDATGSLFHGCSMRGVVMSEGHLAGATFYQCDLDDVDLCGANLQGALINECMMRGINLADAVGDQLTVTKSDLTRARLASMSGAGMVIQRTVAADALDLSGSCLPQLRMQTVRGRGVRAVRLKAPGLDLMDCQLPGVDLTGAALPGARIHHSSLDRVCLKRATLVGASIQASSLLEANMEYLQAENLHVVESQLRDARMSGLTGRCSVFRDVDLTGVDLSHSNLYRAMITGDPPRGMSLEGASLAGAILVQAYLAANLAGANLREVSAAYSRFSQSDLTNADLSGAALFQSTWVKVVCHGARLDGVRAPFFADRCPGLAAALRPEDRPANTALLSYLTAFEGVLAGDQRGST
jgi:uncharacterized protein YjbI with pentapeptide repeats